MAVSAQWALISVLVLSMLGVILYLILQATVLKKSPAATTAATTTASVIPADTRSMVSSEAAANLEQEALFPLTVTVLKRYALREGFEGYGIRESFYAEIESDYELGRRLYTDFVNLLPTVYKSNMQCTIPSTRTMTRPDMNTLKNQMDCILMQINPVSQNADLMTALYMLWMWCSFIADTSGKITVKTVHADVLFYAEGNVHVLLPYLLEELKTAGFPFKVTLTEWSRFLIRKGTSSHSIVNGSWACTCDFSKTSLQQSLEWFKPVLELSNDTLLANTDREVTMATLYDRYKSYINPLQRTSIACFLEEQLPVDKMLSTMECASRLLKNDPPAVALFFLYHVAKSIWENTLRLPQVYQYDPVSSMVELKHASLFPDITRRTLSIYELHQALVEKSKGLTSPRDCPC